ncbi:MAG: cyclic nucleotide-binding domain-containing protein [Candidatus Wallbacteria bacterium]|nr:cyclic nucleotide-binding domain-containing protein [Candidatus Wallbacteria bacterium]
MQELSRITIKKEKNDVIFFQGDPADNAYIVKKGQIEIFIYDKNGNPAVLDVITEGEIFGDMALILNSPRTAGARAVMASELYVMTRANLYEIIEKKPEFAVKLIMIFRERLKNVNNKLVAIKLKKMKVPSIQDYTEQQKSSQKLFKKGTIIFRELDAGRFGYIIQKGRVKLVKLNPFLKEETTLALLGPGEIFGELSLLSGQKRIATAVSDAEDTQLLMFDEENFESLLTHDLQFCLKIMKISCMRIKEMDEKFGKE